MKDAVARFPSHPALKYKEDGIWKTITYDGYYELCINAAKSFLKVRGGAAYLNCTMGLFFAEQCCLNIWVFTKMLQILTLMSSITHVLDGLPIFEHIVYFLIITLFTLSILTFLTLY